MATCMRRTAREHRFTSALTTFCPKLEVDCFLVTSVGSVRENLALGAHFSRPCTGSFFWINETLRTEDKDESSKAIATDKRHGQQSQSPAWATLPGRSCYRHDGGRWQTQGDKVRNGQRAGMASYHGRRVLDRTTLGPKQLVLRRV